MISKDTIKRTAGGRWSDEDECFVFESPLFDRVIGTGDTVEEAREMFEIMLNDAYRELKAGKVVGYNKVGRPAKEGKQLNCKVKDSTHEAIAWMADDLGISQGEMVDVLVFHYLNDIGTKRLEDVNALVRLVKEVAGTYHTPRRTKSTVRAPRAQRK